MRLLSVALCTPSLTAPTNIAYWNTFEAVLTLDSPYPDVTVVSASFVDDTDSSTVYETIGINYISTEDNVATVGMTIQQTSCRAAAIDGKPMTF
ncbi:hypothetical protein KIPB_007708 [Kipferlia bialata]|uniref:Uncharacterized protein n=1 Tax=Kipferlia bialata TaxID=797122 RepID=A0A9K3GJA8_9EUKA|nr:hypothetical protein KIPB_007708 [Kipferlia bialata]|eukprot:g7708.t1